MVQTEKSEPKKSFQLKARAELVRAKERFMVQEKKVKDYIHKNPEKAVLWAAGLGAAIGATAVYANRRNCK